MLTGAGIVKGTGKANENDGRKIYTHTTYDLVVEGTAGNFYAELTQDIRDGATLVVTKEAPVYAVTLDSAGAQNLFLSAVAADEIKMDSKPEGSDELTTGYTKAVAAEYGDRGVLKADPAASIYFKLSSPLNDYDGSVGGITAGDTVRIDCYTVHGAGAQELQIDAENFAGYYYIEADTLFREEATGQDLPAQFVIPRGKIQSNFTFTMAASGDPSEMFMRMAA